MDKQATLDRVIELLHAQGGPGQQHNGCFYRTSDGRKSAVGCLIPDELYSDALEDRDPSNLPRYIFDAMDAETDEEIAFVVDLESAHDAAARKSRDEGTSFCSEWTAALEHLGGKHSLSVAAVRHLEPPKPTVIVERP